VTQGLSFLLGTGTWIGALILAGILANVYSIIMTSNRTLKDKVQFHEFDPQGIEQPKQKQTSADGNLDIASLKRGKTQLSLGSLDPCLPRNVEVFRFNAETPKAKLHLKTAYGEENIHKRSSR
jgi:hypothetical protein